MIANIVKTGIRKYRIISLIEPVFENLVPGINLALTNKRI